VGNRLQFAALKKCFLRLATFTSNARKDYIVKVVSNNKCYNRQLWVDKFQWRLEPLHGFFFEITIF